MPLAEDKKMLLELADKSVSLSPQNKELLKNRADTFTQGQLKNLIAAFVKENEQLATIKSSYNQKQLPLKTQYLKLIEDFKQTGIKKALQKWETLDEGDKNQNLQNLLKDLAIQKEKPVQTNKTKGWLINGWIKLFLLVGVLIAATAGYLFFTSSLKK